jgi:hypothetical protein
MPAKVKENVTKVTQKVRILTDHVNYRKKPYMYSIPVSQGSGLPATGQEHILSLDQMTRKNTIITVGQKKELQMGDNPWIINPEELYPINHSRVFDLSYTAEKDADGGDMKKVYLNPKDYAEYTCFMRGMIISKSKKDYGDAPRGNFYFWIEDKEKEAQDVVTQLDRRYEAEKFLRDDLGSGRYKDVIRLLNFEVASYNIDPNVLSDTRIKEVVFKAVAEHPEVVLMLKSKDADQIVFILKLMEKKVLQRKNATDFYYNDVLIGTTVNSIKEWINNSSHVQTVSKWRQMLETEGA